MKVRYYLSMLFLILHMSSVHLWACTIGFYTDGRTYDTTPETVITQSGYTPVHISDISTFDFNTIDVLMINVYLTNQPSQALLDRQPVIEIWIRAGGKMIIHDRSAGNAESVLLIGAQGTTFSRNTNVFVELAPFGTGNNELIHGSYGSITTGMLTNTNGFVLSSTLPSQAVAYLVSNENVNHIAAFLYPLGLGYIYYSGIPLDYYLMLTDESQPGLNYRNLYLPNLLTMICDMAMETEPESLIGDNCSTVQNLGELTSPYKATTTGYLPDFYNQCGNYAPDRIFYIDVPDGHQLNIRQLSNTYDSQHSLRYQVDGDDLCPGKKEIVCINDIDTRQEFWINLTGVAKRVYWINGAYYRDGHGDFVLEWSITKPDIKATWTGNESTDWNDPLNWDINAVPNDIVEVIIPGGLERYPDIDDTLSINSEDGTFQCRILNIKSNAQFTTRKTVINKGNILIHGGTWYHLDNHNDSLKVYNDGLIDITGGLLSCGDKSTNYLTDLTVYTGGQVTVYEGGTLEVSDELEILSGGTLILHGGSISVGTYTGEHPGSQDAKFEINEQATLNMESGSIEIKRSYNNNQAGLRFHSQANVIISEGLIIFSNASDDDKKLYADLNGHIIPKIIARLSDSSYELLFSDETTSIGQLLIDSGTVRIIGNNLAFTGNSPAITIGDEINDNDAVFLLESGTVSTNQSLPSFKSIFIQSDGLFDMQSGVFNRQVSMADNCSHVIHIADGGVYDQQGGTVTINNMNGQYAWGITIDNGALFQQSGGLFQNDAHVNCYGTMRFQGGTFYLVSQTNETNALFDIFSGGTIQAKNTIFDQFSLSSGLSGIRIYSGAFIGESTGDDDMDFDGCTFQNWHPQGVALTVENTESFTIQSPLFENTEGKSIFKNSSGLIAVTGSHTGLRGGERFDSESEGITQNYITWDNTVSLCGKDATGHSLKPPDNEFNYYASNSLIAATGEGVNGPSLRWQVTPSGASIPEYGESSPAVITLIQNAQITWYSGIPGKWTGLQSSQWADPANWDDHKIPTQIINVNIPADCPNYPVLDESLSINSGEGTNRCLSISLEPGTNITTHANVFCYSLISLDQATWLHTANAMNSFQINNGGKLTLSNSQLTIGQSESPLSGLIVNSSGEMLVQQNSKLEIYHHFHVKSLGKIIFRSSSLDIGMGDQMIEVGWQLSESAWGDFQDSIININNCADETHPSIQFDVLAQMQFSNTSIIFNPLNQSLETMYADFGGQHLGSVFVRMILPQQTVKLVTHSAEMNQLIIETGVFDPNGQMLEIVGTQTAITVGDNSVNNDAELRMSSGSIQIIGTSKEMCAMQIRQDGQFSISGGIFSRNISLNDSYTKVVWIEDGGIFDQSGGTVTINNQYGDYHWGVIIDSGGSFQLRGGVFENDCTTQCFGLMNLDGGIYKLSSGVNETHTHFAIYQNANIQARHTTFSQYNHSSASSGIQIYEGARVGTLEGDDDDDFDQCTFNNWYNNGYALTFSNAESFTITEPTFTNSGGWNINQQTSANIFVTGSNTGSRGGEAFDSDPEGGQSNKIRWENTCTLTGKNATGEAVSPSDNETLYYASDFSVSATGDLISGTVLHWILIPPEAGSPSDGDGQNASFTIHQSAEIVWYSGIPGQWTGAVSSQWSDPANWSDHKVPDYTVDVLISGKLNRYPVLNEPLYVHQNNGTIQCRSLTINPFAALTSKSDVIAYSGIYIKGGTWLQESNQDNAIQIKAGGQLKLLGGNLSVGRTDQDHKTDLLIDNGGFFVLEAGDASISDCLFVNGGGTLQMNGGNLFVGQYSGELTQTPHAVFQLDSDARFYLNGGSLYVQSPCCNDPKGLLFDSSATVVSTGGEIVFRSINSELTHIEADFGDHLIYTLRMNMYSSDHQLKLTGDAQFYQLKINKGQFDLNGNTISFDGQGPSITIGDQDGTDDASFVLSGNGTVNVNQSIDDVKALYIQKDGLFLMSGGSFNRNVLNEDDFDAIIHVASGGVFQQTGGQVLIDNQTPENHWGVWVDSGGQFFIHGGEFYNDAATRCYGDMHIFDSTYYVSSSCNENNVDFIIENNARIQAKNATFSRFCSPSISEGIYIKTGASIGETTGDDTDDFDQCRFENWSSVGTAMTVENPESFTMVQPVFENTYGVNIVKESSGQIVVIGQATGSRGGEKHDSDSDGGLANYIDWENTCSITGKSNTARAVSPGSDKTYYYTCGSQVSALGAGIPLSWEITPVNAASVTAGEDSPAEFMLYDDATIIWYSIKPGLWRGLVSSNWNDSGNWDDGNIPDETLDVTIPYTCTYFPVINQSVSCKHLTIKQHAQITVQSMTLTVKGRLSTETNALINNDNGVIKIDGDFLNTGTFNAQTGTVMLSGYSNCEVKDTSSGPLKFNRLIVHKQNNAVITCGNIYIEKELMLVRGAPHFTGTLAYDSNAVLTYACQTDQTMGTELNSSTFPSHIHINSPAKIFLPYDIEIGDSLTISSGFLVIGDFDLHIPENAVLSGHFSNTAMIVTNGDGLLIRDISQPEKLGFPIGGITGDSVYAPLTLTFISGEFSNASVSVQAKDKKFIDNPSFSNYVDCYWNVTASGLSNYSCNVIASMDESLIQGSKDNLYFGRWDGINWFLLDPAQEIPPIFSGKIENFGIFTAGERDFFESRIIISGYLNHFCGVQSGGISEEKYYAVAGYNLLSDIIITPPPNFEISTTSGSGFITSPQTLVIERQQTTVPETQLYVRFIPPIDSEQHTSSFITHTSDRADTKKVTASGSGLFIRTLTLSAPTPTTDIQVKLELNKENFDYSHVLPGGADIRFMKEAQSFPYWIQSWNPEGKSIIWVLILNAGVSSFDMEYGNTELESISNGTDTFEIYDDFVSSSLDPTIWRKENATTTISDGQLLIYSTQSNGGISSVKSFTTTDTYAYEAVFQARILENNTFILFGFSGSTDPWQPRTGIYAYNNLKRFGVQNGAISISHETNNEVALYDEDMTHLFSVSLNQGYHFDDNQVDFEGEPVSTAYAAISTYLNGGNASVDWIFVRKSAVPDIVSTIGAECNMPGGGIWLGNKSSDWSDPENWNSGGVPKNSDNVIIPANVSNMPRLTAISNCKNIEIKRNASLSLSNYQLNIFGEWKNSGAFIPQTGAICFQGNVDIDASGLGPDTTIMGDVAYSQKYTYPSTSYLGYKFKPDKDITIFSFRSFFGTRISLWNASGKLLASMSTGDEQEKWVDYELPEPLPLTGNESYVLATYTGGKPFYLNVDVASEFTDGIIQESRISSGYDYPESLSSAKWWMVDMIYKKGSGSGFENFHRLIIQKPGEYELTVRSAHIENRLTLKSGRFTVTGVLSYSPEAALEYATGDFTTTITEFPKIDGPQNLIINSTGTVTLSSDYTINGRLTMLNGILQLGAQNFILGSDASVVVSTSNNTLIATNGTGSVRQLLSEPRSCIFPVGNMTPTPQYSPLRLDIVSLQFSTPSSIDVRVENVNYPDNAPPLSLDSINRYWSIQSNNITDFQCNLTASYFDSDLPETTVEKSVMGASWDGTAWTELNQVDLGKNTFDGNATNPLIVSAYEYPLDNSLPTSENKSFLIIENGSYAFSQTDFEFYDDDLYDTFKAIRITQSPGAGQLTYQTAPVQTQQIIAVEHIDDLLYTPSLEEYGDNYAYIMFQVQDSDLGWSESSYIVTINVLKQNEAPRISQESPIHITISEDLSPISWFFPTISAIDPDGDNMTWQIAISPQYGNALVQGSGVHPSVVQYTPVENYFGEDQWVISVQDVSQEPLSDTIVVQVEIEDVNDPPLFDCGPKHIVLSEDFASSVIISVTPVTPPENEASQAVNYSLSPVTNSLLNAVINPNNGTVTLSHLPDKNGELYLDILATDHQSQNASASQRIAITVLEENDPPLFHLNQYEFNLQEDFSQTYTVTVFPEVVPSDETSQSVQYYLSPSEIEFVDLSIDSDTGTVNISKVTNGNGTKEISIWADDGQTQHHLYHQSLLIQVAAINDPPIFHLSKSNLRLEQDFQNIEIIEAEIEPVPTDEANQTIAFTLSPASVSFANVDIEPGTGKITISRVPQGIGVETFVVTADDSQNNNYSFTSNFTLEVIPEMPPLSIELSRNLITVYEDFTQIETIQTILESDDYYTERSVAYSLSPSTIDFAQLAINSDTGDITITKIPNGNGIQTIKVLATDLVDPELSSSDIFTLNVLPVNDTPDFTLSENQLEFQENDSTAVIISIQPEPQPQDESAQAVTYSISPMDSNLLSVSIQPLQRTITIVPKTNRNGYQEFDVIAQEQQLENNQVIKPLSVTVIGVNTPPIFELSEQNIQLDEDFSVPFVLTVNPMDQPEDEIGQSVSYSLSPSILTFINMYIDSSTGTVTFESIPNEFGQAAVEISAHEDHVVQNADYSQSFNLSVESINDSPTFRVNKKIVQVPEDFSTTEIITITPDQQPLNERDQLITYRLLPESVDFASIDINETTGAISIQAIKDKNGSEQLNIIADDHAPSNNTASCKIDLIVYPVNDPPDFTLSPTAMTLIEDFTQTQFVQLIPMIKPQDEKGQTVTFKMMPPEIDFADMHIDPVTGEIRIAKIDDKHGFQRFTIKADDLEPQNNIASHYFDLTIISVNDPPLFTLSKTDISVKEGFDTSIIVNAFPETVPDDEINQLVTYYITPQTVDFIDVKIDAETGQLTIQDNEQQKNGSQVFVVTATDHQFQNYFAKVDITISVRPANDPPIFTLSEPTVILTEDFDHPVTVAVISAPIPPDEQDQIITYEIVPDHVDFANLSFNPDTGSLTITHIPNKNGSQTFTFIANDHQLISNTHEQAFFLEVTAVNDPPKMELSRYELRMDEDFTNSETISCVPQSVPQDETAQTVTYRLSPSTCNFADIQIIPDSGLVTINSLPHKNGSGHFDIVADDAQDLNNIYTRSFDLHIIAINDPPEFTLSETQCLLPEDFVEDLHITVKTGHIPEDEQTQMVRYSLEPQSTPFATVNMNSITGEITIRSRPDENGIQTFKVIANDFQSQHQLYEQSFTINVQSENDPPQFTLSRYSIHVDEDFSGSESILVVPGFAPSDETDQIIHYQLSPTSVNFASVSINKDTGVIQIKSTQNGNGSQLFSVIADDGQDINHTCTVQFSVVVEAINDPPRFELTDHELNLVEDFETIHTVFSQLESIPFDERNQDIQFTIETIDPQIADISIDPNSGKLTIQSIENLNGTQVVKVVADDGQRYYSHYEDTLTIYVQSINDPPDFSLNKHEMVLQEDFTETQDIIVFPKQVPLDELNQSITYQIDPEDSSVVQAIIDSTTGTVQILSIANQSGFEQFTIVANDGQSNHHLATSSLAVTVVAVNDPPSFTLRPSYLTVEEGFSGVHRADIVLNTLPWDERHQEIVYRLEPETADLANIWIDQEEKALYIEKIDNNQFGFEQVTVIADDGQLQNPTASQIFSLTLTSVNDQPVAKNLSFYTLEDHAFEGQLTADDPDNDSLIYELTRTPFAGTVSIHPETGIFDYTPDTNISGMDNFTFRVNDGIVISEMAIVTINITPVNDIPMISSLPDQFLMEGIMPEPVSISITDHDAGKITVWVSSSNTNLVSMDGLQILESETLPYVYTLTGTEPHIFHLNITPEPGIENKTTIQVKVVDSSGGEQLETFDIWVEKYRITANYGENGYCVPSGDIPVNTDSTITFGFYPDEGYEIDQLLIDNTGVDTTLYHSGYTFKSIRDDHSLSVSFKRSISIFVNFITTDPREGYAPLSVSFVSQIQGNVSRLLWDFGDGTTSNVSNPLHEYTKPGNHTVRLTAYGSEGSKYIEKTNYILVKSRKIQGHVVGQDSGLGLSGYTVEVWQDDGTLLKSALTDHEGLYVLNELPKANDLIVSAWPPHGKTSYFAQYYRNKEFVQEANILSTVENDLNNIDFFLNRAPDIGIQGCVLAKSDNLNSGIPGIQVDIFSNKTMFGTAVLTNATGCYSVTHLKPSDDYLISVWHEPSGLDYYYAIPDPLHAGLNHPTYSVSRWQKATKVMPSDPLIQKIDIILDPVGNQRGMIKGTVYKSDSTPLPGVWVSAISDSLNDQNSALTDDNGRYTISELTPVSYEDSVEKGYIVEINTDNYPYQAYNKSNARETATLVNTGREDIHFYLSITRTLSGSVTTQCNIPIRSVKIAAWPKSGGQYQETYSDHSGQYAIEQLQPSSAYIVAIFPNNHPVIYYPDKNQLSEAQLLDLSSQNLKDINFSLLPNARLDRIIGIFQVLSGIMDDKDCYPYDMDENGRVELIDALIMLNMID